MHQDEIIVRFPNGIIGLPDLKKFILSVPDGGALKFMQSIERPEISFACMDAVAVMPNYQVPLGEADAQLLNLTLEEEALILLLLTPHEDPIQTTANLAGPIVINTTTLNGVQVVLNIRDFPLQYPFLSPSKISCPHEKHEINPLRPLTEEEISEMHEIRWWHRIPIGLSKNGEILYTPGEVRHGPDGGNWAVTRFGMPEDLTGKTILDIGGWDGYFAFEAAKRNADKIIVADIGGEPGGNWGGTRGFNFAKKILGANNVEFRLCSVYDLKTNFSFESFDVVFCFGVLYHLIHPTIALDNISFVTKKGGLILIETAGDANYPESAWLLNPGKENDPTNLWYPSYRGLKSLLEYAFDCNKTELIYNLNNIRYTLKTNKRI